MSTVSKAGFEGEMLAVGKGGNSIMRLLIGCCCDELSFDVKVAKGLPADTAGGDGSDGDICKEFTKVG